MTERVRKMLEEFTITYNDVEKQETQILRGIFKDVCAKSMGKPGVLRHAQYLETVSKEFPVRINEGELIVGTDIFMMDYSDMMEEGALWTNGGHFSVDYITPLKIGFGGIRKRVEAIEPVNDQVANNKQAFITVLDGFSRLILRYADEAKRLAQSCTDKVRKAELEQIERNCRDITFGAPKTFYQALQLVYFIQIFLHLEAIWAGSVAFGRMDQYLYPFYKRDVENGVLTKEEAEELIMCFDIKVSRGGDDSQNITLGGLDENGNAADNELTRLFLKAQVQTKVRQPSLSLRVSEKTAPETMDAALECIAAGIGMPSLFNEDVIKKGILKMGVDPKDANDYVIVGCYEATPQGNTFCQTTALDLNLVDILLDYLKTEPLYDTFEEFYAGFEGVLCTAVQNKVHAHIPTVER